MVAHLQLHTVGARVSHLMAVQQLRCPGDLRMQSVALLNPFAIYSPYSGLAEQLGSSLVEGGHGAGLPRGPLVSLPAFAACKP